MQSDAFGDTSAVLDASFWDVAFGARVEVYLLRFFRLVGPRAVAREIEAAGLAASAEGFRTWRDAGLIQRADPAGGWPARWGPERFAGKGERDVLLLAREREAVALINEAPARQFAAAHGLLVLDVPGLVALAVDRGVMPWPAGWAALDRLEEGNRTARGLINAGRELLMILYYKGVR
jgi:hypothetical protein